MYIRYSNLLLKIYDTFYFVTYAGDVKRSEEEVAVDDTGDVV